MLSGCRMQLLLLVALFCTAHWVHSDGSADRIQRLPGLTFDPGFAQYSGFLPTKSGNSLFYWLVESQSKPETDPLQLWLNGGPGCSSLVGMFTELGPFRVNQDGQTIFENVYAWNKGVNLLFLEAPHGVGFSHRNQSLPPDHNWDDKKTAIDNADAIGAFFERFPNYRNRSFYLSGESYGGVYVPTLANELIKRIQANQLTGVKLLGMAVGNGILSEVDQTNSVIDLFYYRGMLGMDQYNSLVDCCLDDVNAPLSSCNFSKYLDWSNIGAPKHFSDSHSNQCAQRIAKYSNGDILNDAYNSYQDCYMDTLASSSMRASKMSKLRRTTVHSANSKVVPMVSPPGFVDQGARINIGSTDAQYGFPCWMDETATSYLNLPEVRQALHVPTYLPEWQECSNLIGSDYQRQYLDMKPIFDSIIQSGYPFRMLIYNGDVDTVCNFLGDEWFTLRLTASHNFQSTTSRYQWNYRQNNVFFEQIGGYQQRFSLNNIVIDLLTVKGSGHFVPLDRGGPALQMITDFVRNTDYNQTVPWDDKPKPTLPKYQPDPVIPATRKQLDQVWYLPGLTFEPNFKQYSGYLKGIPGDYLHYWLVESQRDPENDPLVLWFNGGPGCSSLGGFFSENGPFHPNPDNKTLFENVYAWNKMANVIFLESPRMVGFSWQNRSINPDETWDDDKTAADAFLALMDLLTVFPEYNGRPFYITGESYAGIYIPALTAYTIKQIQAGKAPGLNFVGIAIGNGELSSKEQLNSLMTMLYYRGQYGMHRNELLQSCCPNKTIPSVYCDYSKFITYSSTGGAVPIDNSACAQNIATFGYNYIWDNQGIQDVYNLIEDGYRQYPSIYNIINPMSKTEYFKRLASYDFRSTRLANENPMRFSAQLYTNRRNKINYKSTDGKANFYWYQQASTPTYLNIPDVRKALHIPPYVQTWLDCNDTINEFFLEKYNSTEPLFRQIIESGYPLRMLIYNGNADTACQFLGDEWFIEKLVDQYSMTVVQNRTPWEYQSQRAGYWKKFRSPTNTIDLMTVKGAGHFVPLDRPGPALQMLNNFIDNVPYSTPVPFTTALRPLYKQYLVEKQITARAMNKPIPKLHTVQKRSAVGRVNKQNVELVGIAFQPQFNQFSGYLPGTGSDKLFYWLIETPNTVAQEKPLIIWIGNDPGCSVLFDVLNNIGPYRLCPMGVNVYENPYAWNQAANLLFLESAPGVGFSSPTNQTYTNDMVVNGLFNAVKEFLQQNSKYSLRDTYIFGKGYGSIYALLLAQKILPQITAGSINIALQGIGLGNSVLSVKNIVNTIPNELYFSGLIGKQEWDQLIPCCKMLNGTYDNHCDLSQFVAVLTDGTVLEKSFTDTIQQKCSALVASIVGVELKTRVSPSGNMYRSCYEGTLQENGQPFERAKREVPHNAGLPLTNEYSFIDLPDHINYRSTDAFASYPCYMYYATANYFNNPLAQHALGVNSMSWQECRSSNQYPKEYIDMMPVMEKLHQQSRSLKLLVFDGDGHLENNFLANELFIEKFVHNHAIPMVARNAWTYQAENQWLQQYAGFVQSFKSQPLSIDLITVKGAGQFISLDRPATALQMISNFLLSQPYNSTVPVIPVQPLKPADMPPPAPPVSRMVADQIWNLPGLTYEINFNQYAGYLKATNGNYLHYWFVESQNVPATDPMMIWFTGGPGCSSVAALLTENGPFRTNPDGITLYENVFSWNKLANVLYIESPRMVGFSYQDWGVNNSTTFNDNLTKHDAFKAIMDFFTVFPQFITNDLYISGESYGGIYVPTLTSYMIKMIQKKQCNLTLKGMLVGNGELSALMNIRSIPNYLYFHGIYGRDIWDKLQKCCPYSEKPLTQCPFEEYVTIMPQGYVIPINSTNTTIQQCANLVIDLAYNGVWNTMNYVYDLYQSCYALTEPILPFLSEIGNTKASRQRPAKHYGKNLRVNMQQLQADLGIAYMKAMPWSVYTQSSDALGGFTCFMYNAATAYLNQVHVRDALHVPDFVQPWSACSDNITYIQQHNDTTPVFQAMLDSNYPLRVLIYNGDVDTACGIFEAEWFIEGFAKKNNMAQSSRDAWLYQLSPQFAPQIGGYTKGFVTKNLSIHLTTVKGAGHMVPVDRAGPMLQLLVNFIRGNNFNDASPFSFQRQPLLQQFQPLPVKPKPTETTGGAPGHVVFAFWSSILPLALLITIMQYLGV